MADTNGSSDDSAGKVAAHSQVLYKGLRLILDQFLQLQEAAEATLPDDVLEKMRTVLTKDAALRIKEKAGRGDEAMDEGGDGGVWEYARTAALVDRALAKGIEGVTQKPAPVVLRPGVKLNGFVSNPPHVARGTKFMRSQAADYDESLSCDGPFSEDKVQKPVENACKLDWFLLPKTVKLDFGRFEVGPGMKIELGDPVKCGCSHEAIQAYQKRPMFYKVLEQLTVDFDRINALFSVLVEEARAELAGGESGLKGRMEPVVKDLDDICTLSCNRSAALLYLMCQNSREVALGASGLYGFKKNWLRLAHASKTLFEPGKTDKTNQLFRQGKVTIPKKQFPPGAGRGGGRGGYSQGGSNVPMKRSRDEGYGYGGGFGGGSSFADNAYGGGGGGGYFGGAF